MNKPITILILVLITSCFLLYEQNKKLQAEYSTAQSNIKTYVSYLDSSKEDNRVLQLTIEQLNYYNDSILNKINKVKEELDIKDKNIKSLQYMLSKANKVDTIIFRDTIFKQDIKIDTIMGDEWYQLELNLRYPNIIRANPSFTSEKYLIVNYQKETINPPKKCWLLRLFQKKHKVLKVEVVEQNPYINNESNKFIEIIK